MVEKRDTNVEGVVAGGIAHHHFCILQTVTNRFPNTDPLMKKRFLRLQGIIWTIFYTFLLLYTMQKWDTPAYGFWAATIATVTYFFAVYANAHWLIPRYYKEGKKGLYFLLAITVLAVLQLLRMFVEYKILLPLHLKFYSWTLSHFSFVFITNFLAFAFGALLRVSMNYLLLLRQQEEMKTRQMATELELLKSQVQPHFLFNTLNNIYSLAYSKDDRTPQAIARLSSIMRYFIDEAPGQQVRLETEINFLRNYIELEQIRMLHPADLEFTVNADKDKLVPPMLLIPLVENIFKHGIDKIKEENRVKIRLELKDGMVLFETTNACCPGELKKESKLGIANLEKRLQLLFGDRYRLETFKKGENFTALLQFPV
jgi:sensor histidine kinase YesM